MMDCLIVDDEPLAHEVIKNYLEDIPFITVKGSCFRATEALDFLSNNRVDLIFLDIRMPKLSGLDLIRTLQYKPIIIITSAYEEYALESFDLEVCDYLHKPFRFERLLKACNRALERFNIQKSPAEEKIITIKADKKTIILKPEDIFFLESLGNYVKVWKSDSFLLTQKTMSNFEEQLLPMGFIRIHKSYLVNKQHVDFLEGNELTLKNGSKVPVGKNYRGDISKLLGF